MSVAVESESFWGKRLSEEDFARCLKVAMDYIAETGSIQNKEIRNIAGISYDQAIYFFNRAVAQGQLVRRGKANATHYVRTAAQ